MFTNREDKCGKRKKISSSRYKHFYCRVAGSNQKYYTERFRGTCKGTSLPTGMGPGKKDYVAMSRRFCDMENIYTDTYLHFCETGEDIDPYEKSLKRIVSIRLYQDEVEELCRKSGKVGLSIGELFENFVADLICGTHTNGSDERMYIEQWFDRCYFSIMPEETFLSYLLEMRGR